MNSVSGLLFFVKDLDKTVEFYEKLGFSFKTRTADYAVAYLNWFWLEFVALDKAEETVYKKQLPSLADAVTAAGPFVHISVQNVDEFYEAMCAKGFKPASEPKDFPWGRRELILLDPDGYKLVLFQKK